eukprot:547813-Rhodomonas_salina.2
MDRVGEWEGRALDGSRDIKIPQTQSQSCSAPRKGGQERGIGRERRGEENGGMSAGCGASSLLNVVLLLRQLTRARAGRANTAVQVRLHPVGRRARCFLPPRCAVLT